MDIHLVSLYPIVSETAYDAVINISKRPKVFEIVKAVHQVCNTKICLLGSVQNKNPLRVEIGCTHCLVGGITLFN